MDEIVKFPKPKEEKPKVFDRQVTFQFKTLLKVALVLAIAVVFFCLGRYYFPDLEDNTQEVPLVTGAAVVDTSPEITVANIVEEPIEENNTEETPEPEEEEEKFTTSNYKNVGLVIREFDLKWYDDWGKIEKIYYTISNDEDGTIQPKTFEFIMEGYEDYPKIINVPSLDQSIPKGKTFDGVVDFVFTYNQNTVDPKSVLIQLKLIDDSNNTMISIQKPFDLTK
ncbi:hypothetical protein KY306_02065 [Candidatus Woesearchaeota archaeon]|nr:hypothetical protein [Candidatus Woesearchaeota archaeon]